MAQVMSVGIAMKFNSRPDKQTTHIIFLSIVGASPDTIALTLGVCNIELKMSIPMGTFNLKYGITISK